MLSTHGLPWVCSILESIKTWTHDWLYQPDISIFCQFLSSTRTADTCFWENSESLPCFSDHVLTIQAKAIMGLTMTAQTIFKKFGKSIDWASWHPATLSIKILTWILKVLKDYLTYIANSKMFNLCFKIGKKKEWC